MNNFVTRQNGFFLLGILATAAIFLLDTVLPLGVADGGLYVAVVLIGLLAWKRRFIIIGALAGSALTVMGFHVSPPGSGELWMVLVNRSLAIFMIWTTAVLSLLQLRANEKLKRARDELEVRVQERTATLREVNEELRRKSSFVQLHKDIAVASNQTESFQEIMEYCLKRICGHMDWPVGHLYTADRLSTRLVSTTYWYLENSNLFENFRSITEATVFDPGEGLPGQVLANGKAYWIKDLMNGPNFPRARLAVNIGVRSGFAFPIMIGRDIAGVMEFYSAQVSEPDEELLEIMLQLGTQLGRVIERKRAEEDQAALLRSLRAQVNKLTCLYNVAHLAGAKKTMGEVLKEIGSYIVPSFRYPNVTRIRADFDGALYVSEPFEETPWKIAADIVVDGRKHGALEAFYAEEKPRGDQGPFSKEECDLIGGLANFLSLAAANKIAVEQIEKSREELRNLYHWHELEREEERSRIAREVHDELAQALTAWKLDLAWVERRISREGLEPVSEKIKSMYVHLENTLQEVQRISAELRPQVLDIMGLCEALKWQTREFHDRTGIHCDLSLFPEHIDLSPELSTTLFRIYQETLTNISRHANATGVFSSLKMLPDGFLLLEVMDNGCGIRPERINDNKSFGIMGIRERVRLLGGKLDIQGIPDKGTRVSVNIPAAALEGHSENE